MVYMKWPDTIPAIFNQDELGSFISIGDLERIHKKQLQRLFPGIEYYLKSSSKKKEEVDL